MFGLFKRHCFFLFFLTSCTKEKKTPAEIDPLACCFVRLACSTSHQHLLIWRHPEWLNIYIVKKKQPKKQKQKWNQVQPSTILSLCCGARCISILNKWHHHQLLKSVQNFCVHPFIYCRFNEFHLPWCSKWLCISISLLTVEMSWLSSGTQLYVLLVLHNSHISRIILLFITDSWFITEYNFHLHIHTNASM